MQPPPQSPVSAQATAVRRRPSSAIAVALACLAVSLPIAGCGGEEAADRAHSRPLAEGSGVRVDRGIEAAAEVARRFAAAYARNAYAESPPPLPGATAAVNRAVGIAAARVPRARRRLRPRASGLTVYQLAPRRISASVRIGDGRFPAFSVGFVLARVGEHWRVVAISPPG